jgi:hypothetical protein
MMAYKAELRACAISSACITCRFGHDDYRAVVSAPNVAIVSYKNNFTQQYWNYSAGNFLAVVSLRVTVSAEIFAR